MNDRVNTWSTMTISISFGKTWEGEMESGCNTTVGESGVSSVQEVLTDFGSRAGENVASLNAVFVLLFRSVLLHLLNPNNLHNLTFFTFFFKFHLHSIHIPNVTNMLGAFKSIKTECFQAC